GWMIAPPAFVRPIEKLAQNLFISPPTISQIAATAAFEASEELDGHVARYRQNREIVLAGLPALGVTTFAPPDGAFYVYADVSHLTND
ncbi:aminotransferase class I/II-fold pyridoxal phosphate-dependent enzyme, partial [Priestia megaterium]|uniref:aminotransferase class I/II-fold pyridoxal phosphate-dependent enzyme n=1 Tax=Priestia megaterium TaxID=1404 RepID=UPI0035B5EBA8